MARKAFKCACGNVIHYAHGKCPRCYKREYYQQTKDKK